MSREEDALGISKMEEISDQEMLEAIEQRVLSFLESDPELLFSYLYRLDVLEHKIKVAMMPNAPLPPYKGLARLIFERQKQRIETKKRYRQDPIEGWEF